MFDEEFSFRLCVRVGMQMAYHVLLTESRSNNNNHEKTFYVLNRVE